MNRPGRPACGGLLARSLIALALAVAAWSIAPAVRAGPPEPTASPTPSPPDLELAGDFARRGDVERALGAYTAVISQGTPEERLVARLELAKLHLANDQPSAAAAQLDAYLLEAPALTDVRAAQYLLAQALARQGDYEGALPLYQAYITGGGGGAIYARLDRVRALLALGRYEEVAVEAEELRREELPEGVRLEFLLEAAEGLERSRPALALEYYEALIKSSPSPADQALARWRSAVLEANGDDSRLVDAWVEVIQRFPETETAQAIVDSPPVARSALPLDSYYIGFVYYRAGRTAEARRAFEESLAEHRDGPERSLAARSAFYLAVLDEQAGLTERAIEGYGSVLDLDPNVEQADDALWLRAQLLEGAGLLDEARASYRRLATEYGGSDYAAAARFQLALEPYDAGRYQEAAEAFAQIASERGETERARALLWQGKALAAAGDEAAARSVWRALRREAPDGYYGLRAAALLDGNDDDIGHADLEEPLTPDWRAIDSWLEKATGADPGAAFDRFLYDRHWGLGQELLALGMTDRASDEFALLLEAADDDPIALYQSARFFHAAGLTDLAARAATRLLSLLPNAESAPDDLWRLAYPAPYPEVLAEVTDEDSAPDLLLLAMVRQESFFDPLAGSAAGALGLTQVIPPTGQAIAEELGIDDFQVGHLFRPSLSLRFGAHYIAQQLDAFDGNVYQALAAYNGGPGNAERWAQAANGDVDRFVEEITFPETRAYVRIVLENLARYRQLYLGLEAPSLPGE